MMGEGSNKRQKNINFITQLNIYPLLQRYSVTTVLTLLKEVAQVADIKIDWNELVKKTATGISSAREYQMIWRHLAYRDILEENLDDGALPMEIDSDLEFELEAQPPVSSDASSEASACVKVMIASASLSDVVNVSSVVEAPLCINIPTGWLSTLSSAASEKPQQLQETNITVPVLVPKQPLSLSTVSSVEAPTVDPNEALGGPSRRRRKPWSKKEDDQLLAAVRLNGEGNWANILKGDFKGDRTASQLSQRWAIIKKKKENTSVRVGPQHADFNDMRRAMQLAIDMPIGDKSKLKNMNGRGGTNQNSITTPSNSTRPVAGESSQHQHLGQDPEHMMTSSKSRYMKTSTNSPALSPDDLVKAAAVAAGARIATASDAATLLKAAHSKNAVHIIPTGGNSVKSSSGPSNIMPPNVHYIRTGLVNRSTSGHNNNNAVMNNNALRPGGTHQPHSQLTRPPLPTPLTHPPQTANESNPPKEKVSEKVIYVSCNEAKEGKIQVQTLQTEVDKQAKRESALPDSDTHLESENINVANPLCLSVSKLEKTADLTDIGAKKRSGKEEENKMIEMPVEQGRENKATADAKGGEKGEASSMVEVLQVQEERENKSIAEMSASELEESKSIDISVEEERGNN